MSGGEVGGGGVFVAWEEQVICQERGNRVIHFYLKDASGNSVLAVVGTERSVRHMMYVVPDHFLQAYGSTQPINACKWRARREVVDWLTCLVSRNRSHHAATTIRILGSPGLQLGLHLFIISCNINWYFSLKPSQPNGRPGCW